MKKNVIKSTLAVAILAVAGLGGIKVYESHVITNRNDLLTQNVEALSWGEDDPEPYNPPLIGHEIVDTSFIGYCYKSNISDYTEESYVDLLTNTIYITIHYYEYVTVSAYYRCIYLTPSDIAYYTSHQIPYDECDSHVKRECDSNESTDMPASMSGHWVTEHYRLPYINS